PSGSNDDDLFEGLGDLDQIEAEAAERTEKDATSADDDEFGDTFDSDSMDDEPDVLDEFDQDDETDFADLDSDEAQDLDSETIGKEAPDIPDFDMDDVFGDDEDEEEDDEEAQKAKLKKLLILAGGGVGVAVVLGGVAWWVLGGEPAAPDEQMVQQGTSSQSGTVIDLGDLVQEQPESVAPMQSSQPLDTGSAMTSPPTGAAPQQYTQSSEVADAQDAPVATGEQAELQMHGLAVQMEPGAGVVIPSGTRASFDMVAAWPKSGALQEAPFKELIQNGEHGPLPIIGEDGLTPYDAYARPEPREKSGNPKVALVITGLGMSRAATEAAITTMPPDVTMALSVYARGLDFWGKQARLTGHELLLEVPSESADFPFSDPGPNALQSLAPPEKNIEQLEWMLSRTTGYYGVLTTYGSKFLSVEEQVKAVMAAIKKRGLMYVDGGAQDSLGTRVAYNAKTNWATVEMTLDSVPGRVALDAKLLEFEEMARKRAVAVARVSATPLTLERLSVWLRSLKEKNLKLVPLSSLANKQLIR
ncbi:MAG: divergent polysaccharide deacetylase family protein, partial [Magnetovibrio sp.]|nr:divergent polysaccharide deacetylase family protein [Magnetovibrio sp.]